MGEWVKVAKLAYPVYVIFNPLPSPTSNCSKSMYGFNWRRILGLLATCVEALLSQYQGKSFIAYGEKNIGDAGVKSLVALSNALL